MLSIINNIPKGRYVRLTFDEVTGKSLKWILAVSELRVFGKDGTTNLALNKPVEVSGLHSPTNMPAAHAVDCNPVTFWHSLTAIHQAAADTLVNPNSEAMSRCYDMGNIVLHDVFL